MFLETNRFLTDQGYIYGKDLINKFVKYWDGVSFTEDILMPYIENVSRKRLELSNTFEIITTPECVILLKDREDHVKNLKQLDQLGIMDFPKYIEGSIGSDSAYEEGLVAGSEESYSSNLPFLYKHESRADWFSGYIEAKHYIENNRFIFKFLSKNGVLPTISMFQTFGLNPLYEHQFINIKGSREMPTQAHVIKLTYEDIEILKQNGITIKNTLAKEKSYPKNNIKIYKIEDFSNTDLTLRFKKGSSIYCCADGCFFMRT